MHALFCPFSHLASFCRPGLHRIFWAAVVLCLMAGCAQLPTAPGGTLAQRSHWSGRLALAMDNQPSQSFAAAFELEGDATRGALTLLSPLGSVLAQLEWTPGHARLQSNGPPRESASLDELLQQATGTVIPVRALFSWLGGMQATAPGWQADLSTIEQGRLLAVRHDPPPRATLRVTFER
ncbi:hypothetical protein B2J88_18135 [Rhodococcus sp. SRB_17]|nr:hypothetical protein [Rhodococcus sp. SRB_17]